MPENRTFAVIVNPEGLPGGTRFADGLTLTEHIPQAHKVALQDCDPGEPVIRYGQVIGSATRPIKIGSWVREELIDLPSPPPLDQLPMATAVPAPQSPLTGYTFEGFRNSDGSVATKNLLGITTTVQCVAPTVDYAVRRIKAEILPRFPNVDDVIAITHTYGCGIAMDAPGAEVPISTIRHISTHSNLGGTPLVVSLGCEKLQPDRLFRGNGSKQLPILEADPFVIRMQDERGFGEVVSSILAAAEKRLEQLNRRQRTNPAITH